MPGEFPSFPDILCPKNRSGGILSPAERPPGTNPLRNSLIMKGTSVSRLKPVQVIRNVFRRKIFFGPKEKNTGWMNEKTPGRHLIQWRRTYIRFTVLYYLSSSANPSVGILISLPFSTVIREFFRVSGSWAHDSDTSFVFLHFPST